MWRETELLIHENELKSTATIQRPQRPDTTDNESRTVKTAAKTRILPRRHIAVFQLTGSQRSVFFFFLQDLSLYKLWLATSVFRASTKAGTANTKILERTNEADAFNES
jgi:hypothetical protein